MPYRFPIVIRFLDKSEVMMISIITPVFNGEQYLDFCIKNIINQNCAGIEHIIIDGLSQDRSLEIIKNYSAQYNHIRYISEKDSGQSDAMNKGIYAAKNNIIGFLNVDDFYEPNVLNRIVYIFSTLKEPSFVVGNCNIWNDDNSLRDINKPKNLALNALLKGPFVNPFPANPSSYFYHKSIHNLIGYYDVKDNYGMDLDFILRAVQVANMHYYDETWGNFRLIKNSKTYYSIKNGLLNIHIKNIIKKYKKFNSSYDKLFYNITYNIQNIIFTWFIYNFSQLIYFFSNPQKFLLYIFSKLRK